VSAWWFAIKYCTPQTVALRLWTLDKLLDYRKVRGGP
jgi:hypothetical protein